MKSKGVSSVFMVILLVVSGLAGSLIYSLALSERVNSASFPGEVIAKSLLLIKHYGKLYFRATIVNTAEEKVAGGLVVYGDEGQPAIYETFTLKPFEEKTIEIFDDLGSMFRVGKTYDVTLTSASTKHYKITVNGFELNVGATYIFMPEDLNLDDLDLNEISSSAGEIGQLLTELGIKYERIESVDDWRSFLNNPVEGSLIVNTLGKYVLTPPENMSNPEGYVMNLRKMVMENGLVWVDVPIDDHGVFKILVSPNGDELKSHKWINLFLLGEDDNRISFEPASGVADQTPTDYGLRLGSFVREWANITLPSDPSNFLSSFSKRAVESLDVEYTFYSSEITSKVGSAAISLGNGLYVLWGSNKNLDDVENNIVAFLAGLYSSELESGGA